MRTLLIISLLILASFSSSAQMYERAVGFRIGQSTGIFFEKQNDDLSSYRFLYSWRDRGRHLTAMKIIRRYNLEELPKPFSFYYGYGAHAGFVKWNQKIDNEYGHYWERRSAPVIGVDIIAGISYDFERLPISFTCDVKPYFDFLGKKGLGGSLFDFSIGAIYNF